MAESKNVYQRLVEAQARIVAPRQASRFKSGSRSAEQILEAAKPACRETGLLLVADEMVEFIGGRNRIHVTVSVINIDKPSEQLSASSSAWEGEVSAGLDASQVSGKTGSYAKKYALQNLFAIDDTKDADFEHEDAKPAKKPQSDAKKVMDTMTAPDPLEPRKDELADLMKQLGFTSDKVRAAIGKLVTEEEFKDAIEKTKQKLFEREG